MDDASKVYLPAPQVWAYCQQHRGQLAEYLVCIAENTAYDISVCLTLEDGTVVLRVFKGDILLHEEPLLAERDASFAVRTVYGAYIFSATESKPTESKPTESKPTDEDEDAERDLELYDGMYELLNVLLEADPSDFLAEDCDDAIEDLIDQVCLVLAEEYGISVRRPMLVDTAGIQTREEYPYDKQAGF